MTALTRLAAGGPARTDAPSRRGGLVPYLLLAPGLAWLLLFYAVPLVSLVSTSLQTGSFAAGFSLTFRFANYPDAWGAYAEQFGRSFAYAGAACALSLLLAYPLAYAIAVRAGRWRNVLLVLVVAPFFTSFLVRTLAWTTILADTGAVVEALRAVGLLGEQGRLLATPVAVVTGLTYNFLPFMVLPLYASLERLDQRLVEAAGDLYASPSAAFRRVTLPLSLPGIVAGTLLTFIPAAGDYINAELLGTPSESMVGNVIDSQFLRVLDYPTAAALSVSLMVAIVVLVTAYVRRAGTEELV
ncbi:MAG: Putrescine transport system permease protein PotH [uncultured Pseudonocardia sp.]|uniref:Putrescine transport system permease protein PotH n=1 Tax=uncultured Pseudonocardia sp. TaxID=211455 RepID=A0A6J4P5V1_9PSEU|nr:MAG: Putrescine transport system permease protein PotH [uncultured Pseudonocardia sp.]